MARAATKKAEVISSRREEILAVASQVIAERGVKGATVRDIGQAAGILSGSLYYHFESKEQIVLELMMPSVLEQYERSVAIRASSSSPSETLVALLTSTILVISEHPNQSVILRNDGRTFRDIEALAPIADIRAKTLALWVDVVKQGMKAGEFRADLDADLVVRAMFDGLLGSARWFLDERKRKPERIVGALVDLYLRGLSV